MATQQAIVIHLMAVDLVTFWVYVAIYKRKSSKVVLTHCPQDQAGGKGDGANAVHCSCQAEFWHVPPAQVDEMMICPTYHVLSAAAAAVVVVVVVVVLLLLLLLCCSCRCSTGRAAVAVVIAMLLLAHGFLVGFPGASLSVGSPRLARQSSVPRCIIVPIRSTLLYMYI